MRFEVLGPLQVYDDGTGLDLGGPRQKRVLAALLAVAPGLVTVDRLVDEVWGENPPRTAAHVVRTYVSNLRRILGERIVSTGTRYSVDVTGDLIDALAFEAAVGDCRAMLEVDAGTAYETIGDALALWRGRPFEGFDDDGDIIRSRAASLDQIHTQAQKLRLDALLALGRHEEAVADLITLAEQYPFQEEFTAQLMLALYRCGRQAEALRAFSSLREHLITELGIEPSPQVQHLEERILLQDPGLALHPPHNIPAAVSSFIGRGAELAEVTKNLDAFRMVTLMGLGGVGKTRLASEAARRVLDRFADGVCWVDLAAEVEGEDVTASVAAVLGVPAQPGVDPSDAVARFLSRRVTLVVLDNCEHLAGAVAALATTLLSGAPRVKVLATSRRALHVEGEVRYTVPPMSLPEESGEMNEEGVSDAERLFRARAQDVSPGIDIGALEASDIAEICRSLDGLPLAIEMAAARLTVLSPAQIAADIANGTALPAHRASGRPLRHRSVDATLEWSYNLLPPLQRALFERIAVFRGDFDLDAAIAVAAFDPLNVSDVLGALSGLVDASLVTVHSSGDRVMRYSQLDIVRRFSLSKLDARDGEETAQRHARFHLGLARAVGAVRTTPEVVRPLGRLERATKELAPAVDWSLAHDEADAAIEALPGLLEYWQRRGDASSAYRFGSLLLPDSDASPADLHAFVLLCASFGAVLTADFALADAASTEALDITSGTQEWRSRLWALMTRGQVATVLGDLGTIAEMGEQILELCERNDLVLQRCYGLALLAEAEFFSDGDYEAARRHAEQAIDGFRALHDIGGLKIYGLCIAAPVAALDGDLDAAELYATEAISLPGTAWTAAAYIILGAYVLLPKGNLDRARRVVERGTVLAFESSNEIWMRFGLLIHAGLDARAGKWERAARLFGACRQNLPGWGHQSRWWGREADVRAKLGEERYCILAAHGAGATPETLMEWIRTQGDSETRRITT